jgi:uncharacterized protein YndB with AHSA1/START domain
MIREKNPDLDLTVSRIIRAPRQLVWNAWADPASFEQWWIPLPSKCQVAAMDLVPGGPFVTRISDKDGPFLPHLSACFLDVVDAERIVFTNALLGGWRPSERFYPWPFTAIISFNEHPAGTEYVSYVMHGNRKDREKHEEMGFYDGWGTVAAQLADFAEQHVAQGAKA